MRILLTCAAVLCLSASNTFGEEVVSQLLVESDVASVIIGPKPLGPRLIQLPDTAFTMQIESRCAADFQAESVSISVADTRVNLGAEQLAEQAIAEIIIRIPEKQMGPLVIENFCITDDDPSVVSALRVRDTLSAQVSLKCAAEGRQSIIYQTVALAVELSCQLSDDPSPDDN